MALPNARNQYLKTQIETASKEQLVVMLFDGIIRFTEQARTAMAEERIEDTHHALMRAQAIIMELICTVDKDKGGDVANNLMSLHAYAFNCLIVCNMKKDPSKLDEVQKIYRELREAWVGAMDSLGIASQAGRPAAPEGDGKPPAPPAPAKPTAGSILVAGSTQIPVPAAAPVSPAPQSAPAPASNGYGISRNAMLGAALGAQAAPAAAKLAPTPVPAVKPIAMAVSSAPKIAATPVTAKHNAMLNAYGAAKRSIA